MLETFYPRPPEKWNKKKDFTPNSTYPASEAVFSVPNADVTHMTDLRYGNDVLLCQTSVTHQAYETGELERLATSRTNPVMSP